ncbi:MAG: hypothetical protein WCL16_09660, partial [bacterium]
AGLVIACPDCGEQVQVPIPEGLDIADFDVDNGDEEVRIIHLRELLLSAQLRVRELEEELEGLRQRRDTLEQLRAENIVRFDVLGREFENIQRSLGRIGDVVTSASGATQRAAVSAESGQPG